MLNEQIDNLIKEAMLEKDALRTNVLRAIKAKFLEFKTAKNAKPLDEIAECSILSKMVKDREESAMLYSTNGRDDLAEAELAEVNVLIEFLPKPVTEEELNNAITEIIANIEPIKKNMGLIIKEVKVKYPQADGKILAKLVQSKLVS
jgi:uncharacterized protein YqeY